MRFALYLRRTCLAALDAGHSDLAHPAILAMVAAGSEAQVVLYAAIAGVALMSRPR